MEIFMFCTNCGKEIPSGSRFCSVCGANLHSDSKDCNISEPVKREPTKMCELTFTSNKGMGSIYIFVDNTTYHVSLKDLRSFCARTTPGIHFIRASVNKTDMNKTMSKMGDTAMDMAGAGLFGNAGAIFGFAAGAAAKITSGLTRQKDDELPIDLENGEKLKISIKFGFGGKIKLDEVHE